MKEKRIIFILGGGMVNEDGAWRTTHLDEGTKLGALGDRLRVEAAHVLYHKNPELSVIASGGKGMYRDIPDAPTVADVIKKELVNLGVPERAIVKEEQSGTTWEQLQELKKLIDAQGFSKVFILSSRYHIPRIQAMIDTDGVLREWLKKGKIETVSAEEVLIQHEPATWRQGIENAYQSPEMKKRVAHEEEGVRHLKAGTYQLTQPV